MKNHGLIFITTLSFFKANIFNYLNLFVYEALGVTRLSFFFIPSIELIVLYKYFKSLSRFSSLNWFFVMNFVRFCFPSHLFSSLCRLQQLNEQVFILQLGHLYFAKIKVFKY